MREDHRFRNVVRTSAASLKPDSIDLAALLGPIKAEPLTGGRGERGQP
jgi:hypothetical protein